MRPIQNFGTRTSASERVMMEVSPRPSVPPKQPLSFTSLLWISRNLVSPCSHCRHVHHAQDSTQAARATLPSIGDCHQRGLEDRKIWRDEAERGSSSQKRAAGVIRDELAAGNSLSQALSKTGEFYRSCFAAWPRSAKVAASWVAPTNALPGITTSRWPLDERFWTSGLATDATCHRLVCHRSADLDPGHGGGSQQSGGTLG